VESAYEAESEAEALAHPESRLWIIKYQDGVNEIRDGSTGALIVSGDIDGTLGTFGPAFGVRFKSKRIELRAGIDPRRVVAELPATSEYLKVVPELPGLLFVNTTSRSVELRRIADGSLIDEVRGLETLFSPQASPDGSYLTLQHEGQSYEDRWFELRQAPTWSVVPLGDKPRSIVFSPKGRLFVVGYRGRPTELRTPGVVATFGGELATCVFSADGAMFAISYADRSGEIRSATGALILRLPNPVASLNLSADGRHFAIGYQWERQATATARKPRVDPFDAPLRFDPAPGETAVELRRVTDGSLVVRKDGAAEIVNPTSAKDLYAFMSRAITPGDRQVVSIYHRRLGDLLLPASGEPFALHAFTNAPYLEISPRFSFSAGGTDTFLVRNDTGAFTKIATYFHLGSIDQDLWFNDSRSRYVLQNGELRRTEDDTLLTTIPSISTFRPPSFSAVRDLVVVCVDSVRDNDHCELRRVADGSLIKRIGDTYASEITWSFRADAFYVSDTNRTSALYRSGDGERIMRSDQVTFLPDSLALVKTVEGRFEIWAVDEPKPLADLGAGLADSRVTPDGRYLLAWFRDASPAVIDLVWLRAGRAITSEPTRALLDWACAPFSVSTAIDLSGLNKYISEPTSSATCPTVR